MCAAIRKSHAQPFGKTGQHADIRFIAIRFLDRENEIIGTDCRRGFKARNAFDARVLTKVHCADFRKVESCAGNSRHLGYRLRFTLTGGRRRNIRRCGCRHRSQYQPGSSTVHEDCAADRFKKNANEDKQPSSSTKSVFCQSRRSIQTASEIQLP